jgi:phosphoglycerate dehydrogenase-like enzyme
MVRVGIPSLIDKEWLTGFPAGAELVRMNPDQTSEIEVEFLLAPWNLSHAKQILPRVRGVKVVQAGTAGIEGLLPLIPAGATLCNAQGIHDAPTAEWTLTAILGALKFLPLYMQLQQEGRWVNREDADRNYGAIHPEALPSPTQLLIEELYGKTVLIVGYGAIGKAIEARLLPFEVEIMRIARTARPGVSAVSELHTLLPLADVVVLITPLTPETRHLMDAAALARMKQGALLVNAARGAVVDTDALVAALEARHILAALDVTDPEPLPTGHPLWRAPGLLLTPHIATSSTWYLKRVLALTRTQVARYVEGQPLENVIRGAY